MDTRMRSLSLVAAMVLMAACTGRVEAPRVNAEAPSARAVSVTKIVLRPMAGTVAASGLLVAREEVGVGSELSGFRVAEVLVDEGATVSEGQVLARLDPGLLKARIAQAEAALAQAKAKANQARAEAARVKGLDGTGILSDEQIGSRRSQAASADAGVQVASAQLNELRMQAKRMDIRAPQAGTVLERTVREGDVANPTQTMFRLARDGLIELDAEVPEDALNRLAAGQNATVRLPSGIELTGTARLLSPRVDPLTKLGRIRVALPRQGDLRVGGYARAVFQRDAAPVPAVVEKAVQFEASGPLLTVIDPDNRARRVAIKTGLRTDGFVAIEEGPPVGTRVALGGGAFLLDGDLVDPIATNPAVQAAAGSVALTRQQP